MCCFVPQAVDLLHEALATIFVPIDDLCISGCQVLVRINIPTEAKDVGNPLGIPRSRHVRCRDGATL